jgi:hypothetical protein
VHGGNSRAGTVASRQTRERSRDASVTDRVQHLERSMAQACPIQHAHSRTPAVRHGKPGTARERDSYPGANQAGQPRARP